MENRDAIFPESKKSLTTYKVPGSGDEEVVEDRRRLFKEFAEHAGVLDIVTRVLAEAFTKPDPHAAHEYVTKLLVRSDKRKDSVRSIESGQFSESDSSVDEERQRLLLTIQQQADELRTKNEIIMRLQEQLKSRMVRTEHSRFSNNSRN
ncbi:hypothetical protein HDE_05966 [Halotydeus destructor]|nr:hypothetical protein HDE_05966 [Halotydeus destructor]